MRHQFAGPVVIASLLVSSAVFAADAKQGEVLAKRWCAFCHFVASDQTRGNPDLPTFAAIAKRPDFSPEKIANFLRDPHPKMPNMSLTRRETDDIAAYMATLK